MIRPQLSLDLNAELIVDNFAGGGGASAGIELALGRPVDLAWNHCREAVAMHQANHPRTVHYCESVWDAKPAEATQGRPVGLAWFSPDCKHFSKAKGGKPRDKKIRGLAWVVLRWVREARPRVIILENVEEFQTWAPVTPAGQASTWRKGWFFRCFVGALRRRGYAVEWRELRACDYGAPTIRKRFFLVARCDGRAIVWPEATHAAPASEAVKKRKLKPWRTAAECIDWSLPCPSIFTRARPLAPATCRRIAKGIMRYVVDAAEPFIVPLTHQGDSDRVTRMGDSVPTVTAAHRGELAMVSPFVANTRNGERAGQEPRVRGVSEPSWTVTAQGSQHAIVSAFLAQHNNHQGTIPSTGRGVAEPMSTVTAKGCQQGLVTAHITKFRANSVGHGVDEPMHTITANSFVKRPGGAAPIGIVTSHLMVNNTGHAGGRCDAPMHTITSGNHHAEVRAFLVKYYGNKADGVAAAEPMHTVTARDRFGLVTVAGEEYAISDIGLRMLAPRELFAAQGFPADYVTEWGYFANEKTGRLERRPLTKTAQVRMCGNSVCPPLARALVAANVPELSVQPQRGRCAAVAA